MKTFHFVGHQRGQHYGTTTYPGNFYAQRLTTYVCRSPDILVIAVHFLES